MTKPILITPDGRRFEFTGERRPPELGEWYLSDYEAGQPLNCLEWSGKIHRRYILRPLPAPEGELEAVDPCPVTEGVCGTCITIAAVNDPTRLPELRDVLLDTGLAREKQRPPFGTFGAPEGFYVVCPGGDNYGPFSTYRDVERAADLANRVHGERP